jgi:NAD(P)-dependent dehydrogenase (short-subunit alcohol dehydrogenase family)
MSTVLITGASQGIGRATAAELSRRGHRVIATARNPHDLDDLDVAQRLQLDVLGQASVDAAVAAAGEVDTLISNAGMAYRSSIESLPPEELERVFAVNTAGALRVTQTLLPAMRERRSGHIIFISSLVGRVAFPMRGAYAASKWALEAIGETLASEAAPFGIKVTMIEPGPANTAGATNAPAAGPPLEEDPYGPSLQALSAVRSAPLEPSEIAATIADAVDDPDLPFRIPVGDATRALLDAQHATPWDQRFDIAAAVAKPST